MNYDRRNMLQNVRGYENILNKIETFLQLHISSIMFKYISNIVTVVFF